MTKKNISIIGMVLAGILLVLAFITKVPDKEISFFNYDGNGYQEYVGGDAYNIIIEAELRGGQIAGGTAARAIYIGSSFIIFLFSGFGLSDHIEIKKEENREIEESSNQGNLESEYTVDDTAKIEN